MATTPQRLGWLLLAVVVGGTAALGNAVPGAQKNDEYWRDVRAAAHQLVRDLDELQNAIVADLAGKKERVLFRQVDGVLREALSFQDALKDGSKHPDLYKR